MKTRAWKGNVIVMTTAGVLGLHIGHVVYEWLSQRDNGGTAIAEHHQQSVREDIHGLIVGGSNGYFGLSARELSKARKENWYNASLIAEGFSSKSFANHITKLAERIENERLEYVVYSTSNPYRPKWIEDAKASDRNLSGQLPFSVWPDKSLLSSAWTMMSKNRIASSWFPLPDEYGDLDYKGFECRLRLRDFRYQRAEEREATDFLIDKTRLLRRSFPNAQLHIILAREYYNPEPEHLIRDHIRLERRFNQQLAYEGLDDVHLFIEYPFPGESDLCDARQHGNEEGRQIRVEALVEYLNDPASLPWYWNSNEEA